MGKKNNRYVGTRTIRARTLKEAEKKARETYRGNLVVDKVREKKKNGMREYEVTTKSRRRRPTKKKTRRKK